jgi:hypothetical protein
MICIHIFDLKSHPVFHIQCIHSDSRVVAYLASGEREVFGDQRYKIQGLLCILAEMFDSESPSKMIPLHGASKQARKYRAPLL